MEEIRKHFPPLVSTTYLDTAANGLIPNTVMEWRRTHDKELMIHGNNFRKDHKVRIKSARKTVAEFFGSSSSDIAFIPNFSFGINMILESLPEGQNVLLLKNDYPSVNWPVETRDFDVCYAEIDENLEENIEAAVAKHRPEVFIFSIVQWLNGIKIDLEFLKRLKSNHPNLLLIADGTQYLGTEIFNFNESGIDVLATSGYKWLTAGYGNGFMIIKEAVQERIFPRTIGFNSAEGFESEATDTAFIKHFEPGHLDTLSIGTLEQSILFVKSMGVEKLYNNIVSLSKKAKVTFAERGLINESTYARDKHSSIFNLQGNLELFKKLSENNIQCSPRGGGIRVGFHYYNSESDLEKLLDVIGR